MATIELKLPRLHDAQLQIEATAQRFNVLAAGRRFGKNEFLVSRVIDGSPQHRNGLLDGYSWGWFAPTYKVLDDSWRMFSRLLAPIPGVYLNQSKYFAQLPNGARLECWSFEAGDDVGRSREYSGGLVIDEAAMVEGLTRIYYEALSALTVKFPDAETWFASTPKGRANDFHALWLRGQPQNAEPGWASWQYPTAANPYIPPDELESKRVTMPDTAFRQEYLAEFLDDGDHPIGLSHIAACIRPLDTTEPVVYGIDLARSVDFTVTVGIARSGTVSVLDRWQQPWGVTRNRVDAMLGQTIAYVDSTGVGDPLVEDWQRAGRQVVPTIFTARTKQQMVEGLITAIQQHRIGFPDGWLRVELENLKAERLASGTRYSAPQGLHDDGVMALALAWHGFTQLGFDKLQAPTQRQYDPDRHPGFDPDTHQRLTPHKPEDPWKVTAGLNVVRPRMPYRSGR